MPPEWEEHSATLLHWPSNKKTWPGERLTKVEEVYLTIIAKLSRYEKILLFVESEEMRKRVEQLLVSTKVHLSNILLHVYPINDIWARDCGPIFVKRDTEFVISNWEYNAWGKKYPPWDSDNNIPKYIADRFNIDCISTQMILEGGSIDVNGVGDLLTTESVLLNPNRNSEMNNGEIEQNLRIYLGVENIIRLTSG